MGVFNRKGTVRDGLVLELDAANQKSWGADQTKWKDTTSQGNDGTLTNGLAHSQGPFPGAGYVTFDGTGDYLSVPDNTSLELGNSDFTLEMWYRGTDTSQYATLTSRTPAAITTGMWSLMLNHSVTGDISLYVGDYSTGSPLLLTTGVDVADNNWHHISLVRSGSSWVIYVDGVSRATATSSATIADINGDLYIGRDQHYSRHLTGYISNYRIVKGTALYTSNFTPQSSELTAIPNTKLLTCQKGTITDASSSGHSITVTGNAAAVYNDVSYFDFDGTDQNITFTNSLFNSNQNFTFSVWFESSTNSKSILSSTIAGGLCIKTWNNGSDIMIEEVGSPFGEGGQLAYTNWSGNTLGLDDGQIHNIVVTRVGNTNANDLKIYHNGEGPVVANYINSGGAQTLNSTNVNVIGSEYGGSSTQTNYFDGKIHYVCAFQKALTSTEIAKNFNALRARFGI